MSILEDVQNRGSTQKTKDDILHGTGHPPHGTRGISPQY